MVNINKVPKEDRLYVIRISDSIVYTLTYDELCWFISGMLIGDLEAGYCVNKDVGGYNKGEIFYADDEYADECDCGDCSGHFDGIGYCQKFVGDKLPKSITILEVEECKQFIGDKLPKSITILEVEECKQFIGDKLPKSITILEVEDII